MGLGTFAAARAAAAIFAREPSRLDCNDSPPAALPFQGAVPSYPVVTGVAVCLAHVSRGRGATLAASRVAMLGGPIGSLCSCFRAYFNPLQAVASTSFVLQHLPGGAALHCVGGFTTMGLGFRAELPEAERRLYFGLYCLAMLVHFCVLAERASCEAACRHLPAQLTSFAAYGTGDLLRQALLCQLAQRAAAAEVLMQRGGELVLEVSSQPAPAPLVRTSMGRRPLSRSGGSAAAV